MAAALWVATSALGAADASPLPPLTTVPGSPRLPGKFVWADLVTDDVPAARRFYAGLFGWSFVEAGDYTIARNGERPLGGLFHRARPKDRPEARPRWFGYLSVSNVKAAERAVLEAGGKTLTPPRKVPRRGEQAVFRDPEGAVFGVVKSSAGDPPDFLARPGDWIWIQLLSRDARRAAEFYRTVGGYDILEQTGGEATNDPLLARHDLVLASRGYARATIRQLRADRGEVRPTWLPFVRVQSVQAAIARARELGGQVLVEPRPALLEGKAAVVADPTGAAVGLLEWDEQQLEKGR